MIEYLLKLTPADLAVLDQGLQEVKLRLASPLVAKINSQIEAQQRAATEEVRSQALQQQQRPQDEPG